MAAIMPVMITGVCLPLRPRCLPLVFSSEPVGDSCPSKDSLAVASGSVCGCAAGMMLVAFVVCRSKGRVRSSDWFVGGAGGAGGVMSGLPASAETSVPAGIRYCQSSSVSPVCSRCSSLSATEASWGRSSGARAVSLAMNAATSALIPEHTVETSGTSSCTCLNTNVTGLSALKGTLPVSISQAMMPTE